MKRACSRISIRERNWRGRWAGDRDATDRAKAAKARHANSTPSFFSGTERMRLPVAAKKALSTAGAATQIVGSPTPPKSRRLA